MPPTAAIKYMPKKVPTQLCLQYRWELETMLWWKTSGALPFLLLRLFPKKRCSQRKIISYDKQIECWEACWKTTGQAKRMPSTTCTAMTHILMRLLVALINFPSSIDIVRTLSSQPNPTVFGRSAIVTAHISDTFRLPAAVDADTCSGCAHASTWCAGRASGSRRCGWIQEGISISTRS